MGWEEDIRRADEAAKRYHEWAERERAKGNDETADRLDKKGDGISRLYGSEQRNPVQYDDASGTNRPSGGSTGCLSAVILLALAAAPAVAWPLVERLA